MYFEQYSLPLPNPCHVEGGTVAANSQYVVPAHVDRQAINYLLLVYGRTVPQCVSILLAKRVESCANLGALAS
jgi:hypothetical protein